MKKLAKQMVAQRSLEKLERMCETRGCQYQRSRAYRQPGGYQVPAEIEIWAPEGLWFPEIESRVLIRTWTNASERASALAEATRMIETMAEIEPMAEIEEQYDLSEGDLGALCLAFFKALSRDQRRLVAELEAFACEHAPEILGRVITKEPEPT